MEEITSCMNEKSNESQGVDDSWLKSFGESIGIRDNARRRGR